MCPATTHNLHTMQFYNVNKVAALDFWPGVAALAVNREWQLMSAIICVMRMRNIKAPKAEQQRYSFESRRTDHWLHLPKRQRSASLEQMRY